MSKSYVGEYEVKAILKIRILADNDDQADKILSKVVSEGVEILESGGGSINAEYRQGFESDYYKHLDGIFLIPGAYYPIGITKED